MKPMVCPSTPAAPAVLGGETGEKNRISFYDIPWTWAEMLIGFAPFFLFYSLLHWVDVSKTTSSVRAVFYSLNVLQRLWFVGWPVWVAHRKFGWRPPRLSKRAVFNELKLALCVVFLFLAMNRIVGWMWIHLPKGSNSYSGYPLASSVEQSSHRVLFFLYVMIGGAVEEFLFRGMLYNGLRQRLRPMLAAVLQAIIFGFLHKGYGSFYAVSTGVIGLGLAILYERRRSLVAPLLAHASYNGTALALCLLFIFLLAKTPVLGISGNASEGGYKITRITPDSGAAKAGMRRDDIVIAVDGRKVADLPDIHNALFRREVGDRVSVEFIRDKDTHHVEVVLAKRKQSSVSGNDDPLKVDKEGSRDR
jgi:membrane protease YdiL (CAAX protease family)